MADALLAMAHAKSPGVGSGKGENAIFILLRLPVSLVSSITYLINPFPTLTLTVRIRVLNASGKPL